MITIENFWNASLGVWQELDAVPEGFTQFAGNAESQYYINHDSTHVVRVSSHWGSGIGACNWYLGDQKRQNSFKWRDENNRVAIGIIELSHLKDISI